MQESYKVFKKLYQLRLKGTEIVQNIKKLLDLQAFVHRQ